MTKEKEVVDKMIEYISVDPNEFSKGVLMSSDKNETIENKLELYLKARNMARDYNQMIEKKYRDTIEKEAKEFVKEFDEKWKEKEKNKSFWEHFKEYIGYVFDD